MINYHNQFKAIRESLSLVREQQRLDAIQVEFERIATELSSYKMNNTKQKRELGIANTKIRELNADYNRYADALDSISVILNKLADDAT